jgi:threonylcarbamoyladenosine tRNA methylthiotransferase MtaB
MSAAFFVHNLGCKVNRVESDALTTSLMAAGATPTAAHSADLIIINTCTVTAEADAKARQAVRQAAQNARHPWVIVTGCAAVVDPNAYADLADKVVVIPNKQLALLRAEELLAGVAAPSGTVPPVQEGVLFNTRVGIKVQDGCDNRCTFCIVNRARGQAVSVPFAQIRAQVKAAQEQGSHEIVLTGINLGCYHDGSRDLTALLEELLAQTQGVRFRLSSLEPQDLPHGLGALISASQGRVCAHLHLPLQSGSNAVLAAMGRRYDTQSYAALVGELRRELPSLALTTDVIVGFPGETQADFEATCAFCEAMAFSKLHVFRYSRREGTPAAAYPQQVAPEVKAERSLRLRELGAVLRERDALGRVGTRENVVVERAGRATAESYYRVVVPVSCKVGALLQVQFTDYRDNLMHATILPNNPAL